MSQNKNIQTFIRTARKYGDDKIFFDRNRAKNLTTLADLYRQAEAILGKDINFLQDYSSVRRYIIDIWGIKAIKFFTTNDEVTVTAEHALLFMYFTRKTNAYPELAEGLYYYLTYHQIDDEFISLTKLAPSNKIKANLALDTKLFGWGRCPYIFRKYMLDLSAQEGYSSFVLEKPKMTHIAFLMSTGMAFNEAQAMLNNQTHGLLYTFLPIEVESSLLPSVLSLNLDTSVMDGVLAPQLNQMLLNLSSTQTLSPRYNPYTELVKPIMIEFNGMVLMEVLSEIENNPHLKEGDATIYHLSEKRCGISFKNTVDIASALPRTHTFLGDRVRLTHDDLITGAWL